MKKVTILHLSDLHIRTSSDLGSNQVLNNLISDVTHVAETQNLQPEIVTVTGDIIDRGESEAYSLVAEFFHSLSQSLNIHLDKILMVPGNHDVPRRNPVKYIIEHANDDDFSDHGRFNELWESVSPRLDSFTTFASTFSPRSSDDLFGGVFWNVQTSHVAVKVLGFNSAWAAIDDNDYQRLRIGRWQAQNLASSAKKLSDSDLTIAIMHHPIDWLHPDDQKMLLASLIQANVEVLLHGHIHNGGISFTATPDSHLLTLVSGIGYPESNQRTHGMTKLSQCRYGLYEFDTETGAVKMCLRISRDNGAFVADTALYEAGRDNGIIVQQYKSGLIRQSSTEIERSRSIQLDPVPLVSRWIGRAAEVKHVADPKLQAVAITGVGGQGKTHLAAHLFNHALDYEARIWVDCRELPESIHAKIMTLLEVLSSGQESSVTFRDEPVEATAMRLFKRLEQHRILVVFDNIDGYVNAETESVTNELRPFWDRIVGHRHDSRVIFTSRAPINDARESFLHIPLSGLSEDEVVKFFEGRDIELVGDNDERFARELARLTNGHPWWLGLVAGHANSGKVTLKMAAQNIKSGHGSGEIRSYISGIWDGLGTNRKKLLRYLSEAPRPLSVSEMSRASTWGTAKLEQDLRRLQRFGLVDVSGYSDPSVPHAYHLHPIIREFVHGTYSPVNQRPFVTGILTVFLPASLVTLVFKHESTLNRATTPSADNIVQSIETCLTSRYYREALHLLESFVNELEADGLHHQFLSVAGRTLLGVDWKSDGLLERANGRNLLCRVIVIASELGHDLARTLLGMFEQVVEPDTVAFLSYLEAQAETYWQQGRLRDAQDTLSRYEDLSKKLEVELNDHVRHLKALIRRDSGAFQEALELLESLEKGEDSGDHYGNIGRCLQKLGRNVEALDYFKRSIDKLAGSPSYQSLTNVGYAYLWLGELSLSEGNSLQCVAFLTLAEHTWRKHAAGLLYNVEDFRRRNAISESMAVETANDYLDAFLAQ